MKLVTNDIHFNEDDGHFYFQLSDGSWMMAPWREDGSYIPEEAYAVEDMASNGVGEEDIARVQQFISSLEERA